MAGSVLATIVSALSTTFEPELARQWNRESVAASLIQATPCSDSKQISWDAQFSGATAQAVDEGSDVADSEFSGDIEVPATLPWAEYRSAFKLSEREIDAALTAVGSPDALRDLFGERILGAGTKLASAINVDIYSGTGTASNGKPNIIGLIGGGAVLATGTYAGIARATYGEWAGNVIANGGVVRSLTKDLMDQADQQIFTASGMNFEWVLASAGVHRKYEGLFTPITRIAGDGRGPLAQGLGAAELFYKGKPVYRDKDMPAGTLIFGSGTAVKARFLPRAGFSQDTSYSRTEPITGQNTDGSVRTMTGIPMRIVPLGKTGTSVKMALYTTLQLQVRRPNTFCLVQDIDES